MAYALSVTSPKPFDEALTATRDALAQQGFGILTEIDLQHTLKEKLDADIVPYVILGACRPSSAREAVDVEASVGLLLPCNVVVRYLADDCTAVEAVDPDTMVELSGNDALAAMAADVRGRLSAALEEAR